MHAQHHARDGEAGVDTLADHADGLEQLGHALQGQEVRLHGHDDLVGHGQGVDREQAEAGRAVQQHVVELVAQVAGLVAQDGLGQAGGDLVGQLALDAGQAGLGRQHGQEACRRGRCKRTTSMAVVSGSVKRS